MVGAQSRAARRAARSALNPLHARHFATRRLDARDRAAHRLYHHHHMVRIGVDEAVAASRAMATWPFQNTRSPRRRFAIAGDNTLPSAVPACRCRAGRRRPRRSARPAPGPSNRSRGALAAPQIGRADEPLGDRDEIRLSRGLSGARCPSGRCQPLAVTAKRSSCARSPAARPSAAGQRRQLDSGSGKDKRAQHRDLVGRRRAGTPSAWPGSQPT